MSSSHLLVACLCAEWCGTCRDYRSGFSSLEQEFAQHHFRWIDVEDEEGLTADIDVDNFPTLMIARVSGEAIDLLFAGTLLPHIAHLRRLLQTLDQTTPPLNISAAQVDAFRTLAIRLNAAPGKRLNNA